MSSNPVTLPKILHIGSRHYRINTNSTNSASLPIPVGHLEETISAADEQFQPDEQLDVEIVESENNEFVAFITIPAIFHKFLIGPHRSRLRQLERDFSCKISFSSVGLECPELTITGSSRKGVRDACIRLHWLETNARSHFRPTHFICLPATNPQIQETFESFRTSVLASAENASGADYQGVRASIFKSPFSLHFTVIPLLLADNSDLDKAINLIDEFLRSDDGVETFSGGPFQVTIKGLEYMNDDPTAVNILYAKIAPSPEKERLQRAADRLSKLFVEHDLAGGRPSAQTDTVLLHMTLMNTRYDSTSPEPFSVVGLLRDYGEFVFGEGVTLDELHLSMMKRQSHEEFFTKCCCIKLNTSGPPSLLIP